MDILILLTVLAAAKLGVRIHSKLSDRQKSDHHFQQ